MATRGKSINLFLIDGESAGRIKCTLANWTGIVYKIPRNELEKSKVRKDLHQSGVYFLFGKSDDTGEDVAYIGQSGIRKNGEGVLYRLQEHKRNPDKYYWTEAVVFTTSNNSFGPTEVSYLENRFYHLAVSAKRYAITNGNDPSPGHVTEEKESELEEFIDYAKIVMGALGHRIFEPLMQGGSTDEFAEPSSNLTELPEEQLFFLKRSGTDARLLLTNEGVVLLAGSRIRPTYTPSCPKHVKDARERNKAHIDSSFCLLKDLLFKSPSGAAAFVAGASMNGHVEWKTKDGITLKEVENNQTG